MGSSKPRWLWLSLIGILFVLSFQNCSNPKEFSEDIRMKNTTVVGNPMTIANKVLGGVCEIVRKCHPTVSVQQCEEAVLKVPGFAKPLGLPLELNTLADIASAESAGQLLINTTAAATCSQSIAQQSCSDPTVQAAYLASSSSPFSGVPTLVPAEICSSSAAPLSQYSCSSKVFLRGFENPQLKPSISSSGITYTISPALPRGLTLDASSGAISGNPIEKVDFQPYTITATSSGGSVSNVIQLKTADGYWVNDLSDAPGVAGATCRTSSGTCTLRAAISANEASTEMKTVLLPKGTILVSSPMSLSKSIEIQGDCEQKTTLDGQNKTKLLQISDGSSTFTNLILQNAYSETTVGVALTIRAGSKANRTTLKNVTIRNNKVASCSTSTGICDGGAIFIAGMDSARTATLDLIDSELRGNSNLNSAFGGALGLWFYSQANLTGCSVSDNQSSSYGGGISSRGGALSLNRTLVARNQSGGEGGGVFIDHDSGAVPVVITNSTFAENSASDGGALYLGAGNLTVSNSTFASNRSLSEFYPGAIYSISGGTIENSLFLNNTSRGGTLWTCNGPFVSKGFNLSDGLASDCNLNHARDITSTKARLAPLALHGGPTATMALLAGSAGLGQGNSATCSPIDQRGAPRLGNSTCDIGAFEANPQ